jgi:hypothetical protein
MSTAGDLPPHQPELKITDTRPLKYYGFRALRPLVNKAKIGRPLSAQATKESQGMDRLKETNPAAFQFPVRVENVTDYLPYICHTRICLPIKCELELTLRRYSSLVDTVAQKRNRFTILCAIVPRDI